MKRSIIILCAILTLTQFSCKKSDGSSAPAKPPPSPILGKWTEVNRTKEYYDNNNNLVRSGEVNTNGYKISWDFRENGMMYHDGTENVWRIEKDSLIRKEWYLESKFFIKLLTAKELSVVYKTDNDYYNEGAGYVYVKYSLTTLNFKKD